MTQSKSLKKLPIPITLLSGFLGSGKTTLLEKILVDNHGLKIAVIINDLSKLNIDASLIQNHRVTKTKEKLIQLQNGCICCTLRGDLLEELYTLAKSGEFQYIIIESTGISEPMQVAETFTTEFSQILLEEQDSIAPEEEKILKDIASLGGLSKLASLDTCVTVVDAINFITNFETTEFLADRYGSGGQNEEERTITDLMVDQIEFANVIIINKIEAVSKKQIEKIEKIINSLNPVAKVIKTSYSRVDIRDVVGTKLFDFEKASSSAGWLQSIHEMTIREGFGSSNSTTLAPKPETEEYGINNFVYKSKRPFHPERLYKLIRDKFFVIENVATPEDEDEDDDEGNNEEDNEKDEESEESELEANSEGSIFDSNEEEDSEEELVQPSEKEILINKKNSPFGPLLRSKGFFWLASRNIVRGEWSSAGSMLTLSGGIPWFAVTGPEFYPPEAKQLIEKDMEGEFGDRRNEIVFIGLSINKEELSAALDECLLNDEEFKEFKEMVDLEKNLLKLEKKLQTVFADGFEDWISFDDHKH